MFSSYKRTSIARNLFGGTSAAVLTAASVVGLALATTNVHAQELDAEQWEAAPQTAVRYDDLNLARSEDAREMYRRLQRAALHVCRDFNAREARMVALRRACYENALAEAVADVDHSALTALHRQEGYDLVAQRRGSATRGT